MNTSTDKVTDSPCQNCPVTEENVYSLIEFVQCMLNVKAEECGSASSASCAAVSCKKKKKIFEKFSKNDCWVIREDAKNETLMQRAIEDSMTCLVADLLRLGADPNILQKSIEYNFKKVPIIYNAVLKEEWGIVKLLLHFGAELEFDNDVEMDKLWMHTIRHINARKYLNNLELFLCISSSKKMKMIAMIDYLLKKEGSPETSKEIDKHRAIEIMRACFKTKRPFTAFLKEYDNKRFLQACQQELYTLSLAGPCLGKQLIDILLKFNSKRTTFTRPFAIKARAVLKHYPLYRKILRTRINLGEERRKLLNTCSDILTILTTKLNFAVCHAAMSYLSTQQLKRLKHLYLIECNESC